MIYFAQAEEGGPVKIGFAENVHRRIPQLEAYYKRSLCVLATLPGDREREREIHSRFAHLRLGRTEQFVPDADLMAFIGRPLLVAADPDTVEAMPCKLKPMILQLRGSQAFKDWIEEGAEFVGLSVTSIVVLALRHYAVSIGFNEPCPPR